MKRIDLKGLALGAAAPLLAIVVALTLTTLILLAAGDPVLEVWRVLLKVPLPRQMVAIVNEATVLYLSAVAVAIGFRMNLFNIGVDGQYRIASFVAAVFAGSHFLSGWLNIVVSLMVAMATGAAWAFIAGILKMWRGVSEVISTIMLNAIAGSLVGYLLTRVGTSTGNTRSTKTIDEGSWVGGITMFGDSPTKLFGLSLVAILVGLVVGGIGWLPGCFIGGAFVMFVPNIAEHVSKGLSGAVYGLILLALIYLMPKGAGGLYHRLTGAKNDR